MWVKFITPCMILILGCPVATVVTSQGSLYDTNPTHTMHYCLWEIQDKTHIFCIEFDPPKKNCFHLYTAIYTPPTFNPTHPFNQPTISKHFQPGQNFWTSPWVLHHQDAHPFPVIGRCQTWVHPFWRWSSGVTPVRDVNGWLRRVFFHHGTVAFAVVFQKKREWRLEIFWGENNLVTNGYKMIWLPFFIFHIWLIRRNVQTLSFWGCLFGAFSGIPI